MYIGEVGRGVLQLLMSKTPLFVFYNISRLANALSGGSHKNSVSGRVGAKVIFSAHPFWQLASRVIDHTFEPVDGAEHCFNAYLVEAARGNNPKHRRGNDFGLIVLVIFTALACAALWLPFKLYSVLMR